MRGRYVITANVPHTYDGATTSFVAENDGRALAILDDLLDPARDAYDACDEYGLWGTLTIAYARRYGCSLDYVEERAVARRDATAKESSYGD